jgi:hypothetical protein
MNITNGYLIWRKIDDLIEEEATQEEIDKLYVINYIVHLSKCKKGIKCDVCSIDLKGFVYYQKRVAKNKVVFRICHFCYNMLQEVDNDG